MHRIKSNDHWCSSSQLSKDVKGREILPSSGAAKDLIKQPSSDVTRTTNADTASSVEDTAPSIDAKNVTLLPPPPYRCPGRGKWTNQLKYLLNTVIKPILNLKCARYFKAPVDPILLRVPNYFDIITNPMDLGTIKKRLENNYYLNAQECIDDVNLVLRNCYTFNKPDHFVYNEGRQLEEQFKKRIGKMPFDEIEISFSNKGSVGYHSPKKSKNSNCNTSSVTSSSQLVTSTDDEKFINSSTSSRTASYDTQATRMPTLTTDCEVTSSPHVLSPPPLEEATTPINTQVNCADAEMEDVDDDSGEALLQPPPLTPAPVASVVMEEDENENIATSSCSADSSSQIVSQSGLPILECVTKSPTPPPTHEPTSSASTLSPQDCSVSSAVDDSSVVDSTQHHDDMMLNLAASDPQTTITAPTITLANPTTTLTCDPTKELNISVDEPKDDDCSASDTSAPFDSNESNDLPTHHVSSSIRPPFAVQPYKSKKGVKRKADTTTPNTPTPSINMHNSSMTYLDDLSLSARTSTRKIKPPNKELPGEDEPFSKAFKKSPLSGQMRQCNSLVKELLGKTHHEYAWPFREPVDAVKWNLCDYYEKIKRPMDLGTVKRKMDAREYKTPGDFAADVRLIFSNCYQYNPCDNPVYLMAQKLHSVFENKFAKIPTDPSPNPSLRSPTKVDSVTSAYNNYRNNYNHHHTNSSRFSSSSSQLSSPNQKSTPIASSKAHALKYGSGRNKKVHNNHQNPHERSRKGASSKSTSFVPKISNNHNSASKNLVAVNADSRLSSPAETSSLCQENTSTSSLHSMNVKTPQPHRPVQNPPEYPDANTIAALQQQLQAVMQQLAQLQQGGHQFDAKTQDATNIQDKLKTLRGAEKKPRAQKRTRRSKAELNKAAAAAAVNNHTNNSVEDSSTNVSAAAPPVATHSQSVLSPSLCTSSSNTFVSNTNTTSQESESKNGANQFNSLSSVTTSSSVTSLPKSSCKLKEEPYEHKFATSASTDQVDNKLTSSVKTELSAADAKPETSEMDFSTHNSEMETGVDLGPGQLPLTCAPVNVTQVHSSAISATSISTNDAYSSSSINQVNPTPSLNKSSMSSINNKKKTAKETLHSSEKVNNENGGNSLSSKTNAPGRKSTLKKTTKIPKQTDFVLDSDEEDNATDMTYEEKRQLSSNIDRLTKPQLYRVVHILRAHEPQLQDADVAEITLDLETVKAVTLRALEKFVNQCLKTKKTKTPRGANSWANSSNSSKKTAAAPTPPPSTEPLPMEHYHSRRQDLVSKIAALGGKGGKKSSSKDAEDELRQGINLDPVNSMKDRVRKLSDASSSDDSGDSSSDSDGGSSDSDDSRTSSRHDSDSNSPNTSTEQKQKTAAEMRRKSPNGFPSLKNGKKDITVESTAANGKNIGSTAFANFAGGLKSIEGGGGGGGLLTQSSNSGVSRLHSSNSHSNPSLSLSNSSSSSSIMTTTGAIKKRTESSENSISANASKVLSTWSDAMSGTTSHTQTATNSSSTTAAVTTSHQPHPTTAATTVNSMFQQFQKQARERTQFEQQLKNKHQISATNSSKFGSTRTTSNDPTDDWDKEKPRKTSIVGAASSILPNLSESESDDAEESEEDKDKGMELDMDDDYICSSSSFNSISAANSIQLLSSSNGPVNAVVSTGSTSGHVVDLNEQMNLIDSFEEKSEI